MKKIGFWILTVGLTFSLTACGSASNQIWAGVADKGINSAGSSQGFAAMGDHYEAPLYTEETASDYDGGSGSAATKVTEAAASDRKMIRTVNMDVETQEYDALISSVEQKVIELGGYIQNMESYNGSKYNSTKSRRYANLTLRIPKENADAFINNVAENSNVVRRNESMEDVTLQYVDLDSHKKVLQAEQERLLELMDRTESTEDIYLLEQRLADVRYQIESMESQLRTYDNKVDYSTIYLYIDEVEIYTPVQKETVWQRISGGFTESVKDVAEGLVDFVVWLIVSIPYLLVWAAVIAAIVFCIRAIVRKNRKKKEKKQQALAAQQAQPVQPVQPAQQSGEAAGKGEKK